MYRNSTKLVWMSRHAPTPSQVRELDRLFPGHDFLVDGRSFSDAADIATRFRAVAGDEMVVVAPLTVVNELVKQGIRPLIAIMERVPCHDSSAEIVLGKGKRRRCQKFIRFERVEGIDFRTTTVVPPPTASTAELAASTTAR